MNRNNIMIKVYNHDEYGTVGDYEPIAIFICRNFWIEKHDENWFYTLHGMVDAHDLHYFKFDLRHDETFEVYSMDD